MHFSWQVRALVPPSIAASLAKSTTLTSLHLWAHSIHSAYLLGNLSLTELRVARSKHGADAQCDKLLDAAYLPLTDGTAEENEVVYQMRDKRDLSAYRGLIESNHTTLERLCIEPDLRSLLWMETVFGKPAELDRVDHNAIANGAAPAPPIFSPGEQCLPFLALPRLKNVQFTLADLTSPSWTHLLATSPELESMCIEHLPEDEGNEISPGAPEGSLKKLKALHYRGGRMEGQIEPFPLREGFENFLGAGGQETKVEDLGQFRRESSSISTLHICHLQRADPQTVSIVSTLRWLCRDLIHVRIGLCGPAHLARLLCPHTADGRALVATHAQPDEPAHQGGSLAQ